MSLQIKVAFKRYTTQLNFPLQATVDVCVNSSHSFPQKERAGQTLGLVLSRQTPTIRAHLAFHPEPGSLHTLDWYMHKFPEIPEARISETVHFCGPVCSRLHLHSSSRTLFSPGTRGCGATCDNRDSTAWHFL